jgi:glucokinase
MPAFSIGVDLGGTNLRIAAVEESGTQLEGVDVLTEISRGREKVVDEITEAVRSLTSKYSSSHKFLGLGIGVPGIIDLQSGTVHSASNLPDWSGYPVRNDLESRLGTAVILENDANCAAVGEKWLGAGQHVEDLCMLTLGTGVGGGFVVNGRPWHGVLGMAGELGHMTVIPEGRACPCGNHGCLEQYASATAIRRAAVQAAGSGESPCLAAATKQDPALSARTVYTCAQAGDPAAFNLPVYVIGGGVSRAWDQFSPAMFQELTERSIVFRAGEQQKRSHRATEVKPAQLRDRAGLIGAARLPMIMQPGRCCSLAV